MDIRERVNEVIIGIVTGKISETFDQYYDDNVVINENGMTEKVGKATNRVHFLQGLETFHSAKAISVVVDGHKAAVEWIFEITPKGGKRITLNQLALQIWRNGKILHETYYSLQSRFRET